MSVPKQNKSSGHKSFEKRNSNRERSDNSAKVDQEDFLLRALSVIVGAEEIVDISDCGFTAEATYFCPEHAKKTGCKPNASSGGWVPAATIRKKQYARCKQIKQNTVAPHFNDGYDNSFR